MKRCTIKIQIMIVRGMILLTYFNSTSNGQKQQTDNNVKWLIKPQFDYADDFCEGMACVENDLYYGYVSKKGKVIETQYDEARDFSEGLAAVEKDGKWGFIKNPLKAK